jgi:hypothetical protein
VADEPTDTQILGDPSAYTVEQVLGAFEGAALDQVAETQALEAAGKNRRAIADYKLPVADDEPRYARDRILDVNEGSRITGLPHPVIVGALDGDDSKEFTPTEVRARAEAFRSRTVHTEEA